MSTSAGGIQARHQTELDQGRFLIQRCAACTRHVYFPRQHCPHCGADALSFVEPAGTGTVHAVTTVRRKPEAGGDYGVCLVDLDEDVRMMARVTGLPPSAVNVGLRVRAQVVQHDGHGLVLFTPLDATVAGEGA